MTTKDISQEESLELLIRAIEKRTRSIKERQTNCTEVKGEEPKKKKGSKQIINSNTMFFKVASIIFVLGAFWIAISYLFVPDVKEAIMVILDALNPFKGIDPANPTDFVN